MNYVFIGRNFYVEERILMKINNLYKNKYYQNSTIKFNLNVIIIHKIHT